MKTAELLIAYGYTEVSPGMFLPARASSERWEKTDGGWLCYRVGGEEQGGRPIANSPLIQIPYRTEVHGVNPRRPGNTPDAFEWVWPDERLQEIYAHAVPTGDNTWQKLDDGSFVKV